MAKILEGTLIRGTESGPISVQPLGLDGGDGFRSLDQMLRSFEGSHVKIIIEILDDDAKQQRPGDERDTEYSPSRRRRY